MKRRHSYNSNERSDGDREIKRQRREGTGLTASGLEDLPEDLQSSFREYLTSPEIAHLSAVSTSARRHAESVPQCGVVTARGARCRDVLQRYPGCKEYCRQVQERGWHIFQLIRYLGRPLDVKLRSRRRARSSR